MMATKITHERSPDRADSVVNCSAGRMQFTCRLRRFLPGFRKSWPKTLVRCSDPLSSCVAVRGIYRSVSI